MSATIGRQNGAAGVLGALERELGAAARAFRDLRLVDRSLVEAALQGVVQVVFDDLDRLVDDRVAGPQYWQVSWLVPRS